MQFCTQTKPPKGQPVLTPNKAEEIKSLLFQAVMLYVADNESARVELIDLLTKNEMSIAS